MVKTVADAIDELLDREQADQRAAKRDRGIERGDRRARRQAKTAKAADIVLVAEPDQTKGDAEHHDADDDLDDQPRRAMHRLGNRGQIEMIVAAGRAPRAPENSGDENSRGGLLPTPPP